MAGALHHQEPIFSVASFRAWLTSRPAEEHWELIGGVPMMMAPPTATHQRITSNLETLLNAALKTAISGSRCVSTPRPQHHIQRAVRP
jgi:Uma2 family endonuclease